MEYRMNACFDDEMIKELSSMKGKTLKAITGVFENGIKQTIGNIRLVLGQYAVDIENYLYPIELPSMQGGTFSAEYSKFSCHKRNLKDPFNPYVMTEPISFMFNQEISDVMIVRDEINVSNGEHHLIDQALVIKTVYDAFTVSKPCWFMENIDISIADSIDGVVSLKEVREDWSGEGQYKVEVERHYIFL